MINTWYKTLEVDKEATLDDVRISYKKLILIYHPDKGGDAIEFEKIQNAYEFRLENDQIVEEKAQGRYVKIDGLLVNMANKCHSSSMFNKRSMKDKFKSQMFVEFVPCTLPCEAEASAE